MKLAIIADIHSNADALEAVLEAAFAEDIDALLVAGDLIGYYFEPAKVLRLLKSWPRQLFIVRGNHEDQLGLAKKSKSFLSSVSNLYIPGLSIALQ